LVTLVAWPSVSVAVTVNDWSEPTVEVLIAVPSATVPTHDFSVPLVPGRSSASRSSSPETANSNQPEPTGRRGVEAVDAAIDRRHALVQSCARRGV
jgi:hypothetical protein